MNAPRPSSISDYQAYAGADIEVVGKNMTGVEFGGTSATQVRLNDGNGNIVMQTLPTLAAPYTDNPYDLTFAASGTVGDTYYVEVSNDGGTTWSRLNDGQTLTIVSHTGTDPLGLGVSWAQNFNWTNSVSVTTHNAVPNSSADQTSDIQATINQVAGNANGRRRHFPGRHF